MSAFVDRELQPLLANIHSYIIDTTDFLNKLSRFDNLPDNTILVTLDVTALYSGIPHNDGIGACKKYLDRRALSTTSSEDICQLIKFILENNVFSLMMNSFYKYAVQPWAPEWRHATLISSWLN